MHIHIFSIPPICSMGGIKKGIGGYSEEENKTGCTYACLLHGSDAKSK